MEESKKVLTTEMMHNLTNDGLDVFNHYIKTPFEVDDMVFVDEEIRFKVFWSTRFLNYVVKIEKMEFNNWEVEGFYNSQYFVQHKFSLDKRDALKKIFKDLNLEDDSDELTNPSSDKLQRMGFECINSLKTKDE